MSSRPFLARLVVVFAALLALIVAVCGGVIYLAGQRAVRAQQEADLSRLLPLARAWVAVNLPAEVPPSQEAIARLRETARVIDTRVTVIAGDGRVLADTLAVPAGMSNHNGRPEVVAARAVGHGASIRHSTSIDEESVYVAELFDPARRDGLVLRLSFPRRTWAKYEVPVWPVLAGGALAAVLAVSVLWSILQKRWIAPTRRLIDAAEQMAAGNWSTRVQPSGGDELQFFTTRLNLVASHAQRQLADLRDQRTDLQALVDTLPDPVLATDPDGKVILINLPAARLLSLARSRAIGQNVVNVVTDGAVIELFDRARGELHRAEPTAASPGSADAPPAAAPAADASQPLLVEMSAPPLMREIRLSRDGQWLTFQAVAKRTAAGGVLLVLRDVTALASAVQMKTDFVANASHELRTPIAAIKIAFETLRDVYGDDAHQTDRCLAVIDGHLRRLEEMLRDLLDLSRVENPNLKPHVKRMKTAEVYTHVRSSLGPMARQKGVELILGEGLGRDPTQPAEFLCDERLLNLILKNLVENGVKFTPPGGSITVLFRAGQPATEDTPATVVLSVRDTGIGIAPEHLDRVFERFYQVDAARSGSAGRGTGLGLAIVKHAINALGGQVELESAVGQGTTIICSLPQIEPEPALEESGVA